MLYTNLKLLRSNSACSSGLLTLIASLPKDYSEERQISLAHVLKSNGLNHAIWALRATTIDSRKIAARMAIDFAYQSLSYFEKQFPKDKRPRTALELATAYLDGKITLEKLESAWSAVRSAVRSAAESTELAAWSAESAARSAAWAVRSAARSTESAELPAWSAAESTELAAESAAESTELAADSAAESAAAEKEQMKIFKKWIVKSQK